MKLTHRKHHGTTRRDYFQPTLKKIIEKGSEGYLVSGKWMGFDAAYKFVEIRSQKIQNKVSDALKDLKKRLMEINSLKAVKGSRILEECGHFR